MGMKLDEIVKEKLALAAQDGLVAEHIYCCDDYGETIEIAQGVWKWIPRGTLTRIGSYIDEYGEHTYYHLDTTSEEIFLRLTEYYYDEPYRELEVVDPCSIPDWIFLDYAAQC